MTYRIKYFSEMFPDGNTLNKHTSVNESNVLDEMDLYARSNTIKVQVFDNDTDKMVWEDNEKPFTKPFKPLREPKRSVIEV